MPNKEQIAIIILGAIAIIAIMATIFASFRQPERTNETAEIIKALAPLLKKEERQNIPQIINRLNSDDIRKPDCCDSSLNGK